VLTGVFGGSFDPPHNGHLAMCLFARELLQLDRLVVSVSRNPFKSGSHASDRERVKMAKLLIDELNATGRFAETSTWEMEQPGPSYTVDLLHHLSALYPDDELLLLVGEDSYRQMGQWKAASEIPRLCQIVYFGREGYEDYQHDAEALHLPVRRIDFDMPVSATEIRRLVASGQPVSQLVPPSITHYIAEHGLYRP